MNKNSMFFYYNKINTFLTSTLYKYGIALIALSITLITPDFANLDLYVKFIILVFTVEFFRKIIRKIMHEEIMIHEENYFYNIDHSKQASENIHKNTK